jgi:hypothetical protein
MKNATTKLASLTRSGIEQLRTRPLRSITVAAVFALPIPGAALLAFAVKKAWK